ncbi:alpha/beta fold hydrolase [Flindersiella endophytica]
MRIVVGLLAPVLWGALAGWLTPRGPLTVAAALVSIVVSLGVGLAAGWILRSRWALPAAPVLFSGTFELVRLGATGPTVDAPHLSLLGVLALVAGRGVHALLTLLPMLVGAAYGAGLARRRSGAALESGRFRRYAGRAAIGVLAAAVALVTVAVVLPARTQPIAAGPGARSIAELTTVTSGSHRLGLMIRGADVRKPVLLFVPGAPGAAERGAVRAHLSTALEPHFVVATLDRRGGGSSYPALEPTSTLTLDSEVSDVLATATYLQQRFHTGRIYLVAHSGGTIPAVLAVQRRPNLFRAYVGVGQAVATAAADRAQYAATLSWARHHHDAQLVAALTKAGRPPYARLYDYEPMLLAEPRVFPASGGGQGGLDESLSANEYTFLDKAHVLSGFADAYDQYYPRTQSVDLRVRVRHLQVPAYFVDGAGEVPARIPPFRDWFDALDAPHKEHIVLPDSGHRSLYQRPSAFATILTTRVAR